MFSHNDKVASHFLNKIQNCINTTPITTMYSWLSTFAQPNIKNALNTTAKKDIYKNKLICNLIEINFTSTFSSSNDIYCIINDSLGMIDFKTMIDYAIQYDQYSRENCLLCVTSNELKASNMLPLDIQPNTLGLSGADFNIYIYIYIYIYINIILTV